jgi:hypothetical protein
MVRLEKNIKKFLKDRGIQLKDFVEAIGISQANIYNIYERNSIETKYLEKTAEIYKVPIYHLLLDENLEKVNKEIENSRIKELTKDLKHCSKEVDLLRELLDSKNEIIDNLRGK